MGKILFPLPKKFELIRCKIADPLFSDNHHFDNPSAPQVQTGNEEWNQVRKQFYLY